MKVLDRMKVLDLFCGPGGASIGYLLADSTAHITGVDVRYQRSYPVRLYPDSLDFVLGEALAFAGDHGHEFDFIHASPPCQAYSYATDEETKGLYAPLIHMTREILTRLGKPYVIENVRGARTELINPLMLCGTQFGKSIPRHRFFETNFPVIAPPHRHCHGSASRYAKAHGISARDMVVAGHGSRRQAAVWREQMAVTWPVRTVEISEMIPPYFTEFIMKEYLRERKEHA